jgi:flagellar basal body rod protein FlgG
MAADKPIMDVMSAALGSMQNAQSILHKTAEHIAAVSPESSDAVDLSSQMVAMLAARNQYQTNARVIQTADDMQKKVLDLLA